MYFRSILSTWAGVTLKVNLRSLRTFVPNIEIVQILISGSRKELCAIYRFYKCCFIFTARVYSLSIDTSNISLELVVYRIVYGKYMSEDVELGDINSVELRFQWIYGWSLNYMGVIVPKNCLQWAYSDEVDDQDSCDDWTDTTLKCAECLLLVKGQRYWVCVRIKLLEKLLRSNS